MIRQELWKPSASLAILKQRAQFMSELRAFFTQRAYLEVETPIMAAHGVTDVYLSNLKTEFRKKTYYLQTSPEYHMKRLLAAGSGPVFQIARVFRDDELGRWHNPEFTMLEWYQLGVDHHALMEELDLLLQSLVKTGPALKKTYQQVFMEACDLDPFNVSLEDLKKILINYQLEGVLSPEEQDKDQYLFLLMSHVIEPFLAKEPAPVLVYDFPPSQACLAKINNQRAERFELYWQGVELANGFHELTETKVQAERFASDQQLRGERGLDFMVADSYLLEALAQGLPACAGVALGVDRLLALALGQTAISEVFSFNCARA